MTTAVETVAAPRHRPGVLSRAWALVRRHTLTFFAVLAFAYLLVPIVVVVVFSFNDPIGRFNFAWQGFTLNNWLHPFDYPGLSDAVRLSIEIALASSFFATIIGTLMAMALVRHQFLGQGATNLLIFLPMATPEIVMGSSLLTLFLNQGPFGILGFKLGFVTILIAHIMFNISFVVVTVRARLAGKDQHLEEAAADLYANPLTAFLKVTLPLIYPGDPRRVPPCVRPLRRRLRHHIPRRRRRPDLPALRVGSRHELPFRRRSTSSAQPFSLSRSHSCSRTSCGSGAVNRKEQCEYPVTSMSPAELQKAAREHLWLHFTRMSSYTGEDIPIIVRGDGCYLEDINGKRYLDALAGLFAVNIGYGFGDEIGEAAAAQLRELPFYTNWSYAHPRAIELAAEVASVAPGT